MTVGLQNPCSYPITYFLVNHMDFKMQAQIIKESINLLTDAGLDVHAVTFDGCSKNLATARRLGCKIDSFDGSFQHPTRPGKTLYVMLDQWRKFTFSGGGGGQRLLNFRQHFQISDIPPPPPPHLHSKRLFLARRWGAASPLPRHTKVSATVLNICHMLKFARNALGYKQICYTSGGETISWYYINGLFNVQQSDILHLGNKLKNVHTK